VGRILHLDWLFGSWLSPSPKISISYPYTINPLVMEILFGQWMHKFKMVQQQTHGHPHSTDRVALYLFTPTFFIHIKEIKCIAWEGMVRRVREIKWHEDPRAYLRAISMDFSWSVRLSSHKARYLQQAEEHITNGSVRFGSVNWVWFGSVNELFLK
jgi:hypothetical protein